MTEPLDFLPWQVDIARDWLGSRDRFAHAWLIHGLGGIGKRRFAIAAAASLLCEQPRRGLACGHCAACHWFAGGNHPDLRRIRPDVVACEEGEDVAASDTVAGATARAPSAEIRVEQLRALSGWFNTATHRGGWRVAILYPAAALNAISANALLKVLEEPPEHTVFLIVADAPDRLLPTLVSRCRRLPLPIPAGGESIAWLEAQGARTPEQWLARAGGAPLRALRLAHAEATACPRWLGTFLTLPVESDVLDVGPLADELSKISPEEWLDALQRLFVDLALARVGAPVRYYPALQGTTHAVAHRASLKELTGMGRWLARQRAVARHPLNVRLLTHAVLDRAALAWRPLD